MPNRAGDGPDFFVHRHSSRSLIAETYAAAHWRSRLTAGVMEFEVVDQIRQIACLGRLAAFTANLYFSNAAA